MGIFGTSYYSQTQTPLGPAGARSRAAGYDSRRTAVNPLLAMIFTATVGGTASDGVYSISVVDDLTGETYATSFTRGNSETNAQIAGKLKDNWNAVSKNNDVFTAASPAAVITFTGKVAGRTFTVSKSAPGTGTITLSTTQAGGGTKLPAGIFVARKTVGSADGLTPDAVRLLTGSDTVLKIWGFIERPCILGEIREVDGVVSANDKYNPGDTVPVMREGSFWVDCETSFDPAADTPYIRFTATGDEVAGVLRNDADGGDALDASTIVKVIQGTAAAGRVEVHVSIRP